MLMQMKCMYMFVHCMYSTFGFKAVTLHIKWITSGTHDTPAQF
jgi:hypothetical protein